MRRLKNGRTRQNWVKVPSQKGMRISIKAALKVQEIMKTKYNLPFLMGSRINQCYLENFFCQIRQMNENVPRPSALQFNRRVAKWIIQALLKINFNILSLKKDLPSSIFQDKDNNEWQLTRQSFRHHKLREAEKYILMSSFFENCLLLENSSCFFTTEKCVKLKVSMFCKLGLTKAIEKAGVH